MTTPSANIPTAILCQAHPRPAGVSLLDSMTHAYEQSTGRKSTLPSSTLAKLESANPTNSATPTAALSPVGKEFVKFIETGTHPAIYKQQQARSLLDFARSLILENARKQSTASPSPLKATAPAKATAPPASKPATDILAQFDAIGNMSEKVKFFRANESALKAAESKLSKFDQYKRLQQRDPHAAGAFWDANEKEIIAGK